MTYASLAKSWATVAADSGAAVGAPASASPSGHGHGNGVTPSNGGWGGAADVPAVGGAGLTIEQPVGQAGSGLGHGSSRPSSATGKVRERERERELVDGQLVNVRVSSQTIAACVPGSRRAPSTMRLDWAK